MTLEFDPSDRVVCVATDEAFVLPTAVTLRSVAIACSSDVHCVVLHDGVDIELRDKVNQSVPTSERNLHWVDMSDSEVKTTDRMHLPGAANFRLFIDALDIEWPDRILYIDVDTIVRKDLVALWELDLGGNLAAAVRSVNFPSICSYGAVDHWPRLGLEPRQPFFNSGVLLIDTVSWRRHEIGRKTRAFLSSDDAASQNADQEALNVCLAGNWLELGAEWNQQAPLLDDNRGAHLLYDDEQIGRARRDPVIVHFTDRPKPWHRDCRHPWRAEWRAIAKDTALAPAQLDRTALADTIAWRLKRAASALVKGR